MTKPPAPSLKCNVTTCDLNPGLCEIAADGGYQRRDFRIIEKRGPPRPFKWPLHGYEAASALYQIMRSRSYPNPGRYMRILQNGLRGVASRWWRMRSVDCGNPNLHAEPLSRDGGSAPRRAQVEHIIPVLVTFPFIISFCWLRAPHNQLSTVARFATVANWGRHYAPRPFGRTLQSRIPEGEQTDNPRIENSFFENCWNTENALPAGLPRVSENSPDIRTPSQRIYEQLGSTTNPDNLVLLESGVNAAKNRIENFQRPISQNVLEDTMVGARQGDESSIRAVLSPLREVSRMNQSYMHSVRSLELWYSYTIYRRSLCLITWIPMISWPVWMPLWPVSIGSSGRLSSTP